MFVVILEPPYEGGGSYTGTTEIVGWTASEEVAPKYVERYSSRWDKYSYEKLEEIIDD